MKVDTYACDGEGCKAKRVSDSNHWYVITIGSSSLIITAWSDALPEEIDSADAHLCGRTCLLKKVNELLDVKKAVIQA